MIKESEKGFCRKCKIRPWRGAEGGKRYCLDCYNAYQREYWRYPKKRKETSDNVRGLPFSICIKCKTRPRQMKEDGRYKGYCIECHREDSRSRYWANRDSILIKARQKYKTEQEMVFNHYGNACQCCNEWRKEFLTIDHIDGYKDGFVVNKKGRKIRKVGANRLYTWLIKNNFPSTVRLLCWSCNLSRGLYGYCPHEKEKAAQDVQP